MRFLRVFKKFLKVVRGGKNGVKWGKMGVKSLSQYPHLYTTQESPSFHDRVLQKGHMVKRIHKKRKTHGETLNNRYNHGVL